MNTLTQIRFIWKPIVFLACLVPFALAIGDLFNITGSLGANPVEELQDRLNRIKSDMRGGLHKDTEEQAVELENVQVLDALGNETQAELSKISKAIDRLQRDEYGICVSCLQPIAEARLQANMYADMCVRCAEAADASSRK